MADHFDVLDVRLGTLSITLRSRLSGTESGSISVEAVRGGVPTVIVAPGSRFFEDTTYHLRAESSTASRPSIHCKDRSVFADLMDVNGILAGSFSFGRHVGDVSFTVSDLEYEFKVTVRVFPRKLEFESDFERLLRDCNDLHRALVTDFLSPATVSASLVREPAVDAVWLINLERSARSLMTALQFVARMPHRRLVSDRATGRIETVKRSSSNLTNAIRAGRGSGGPVSIQNIGLVRERIVQDIHGESVDVFENRWIRASLAVCAARLLRIRQRLIELSNAPSGSASRRAAEVAAVARIQTIVEQCARTAFLSHVSLDHSALEFSSIALASSPGYAETFRILNSLNRALDLCGDDFWMPIAEIAALYEMWCFISIGLICSRLPGVKVLNSSLFSVHTKGLRTTVGAGKVNRITLSVSEMPGRTLSLVSQARFPSPTGTQRPDIILIFEDGGKPPLIVVFDAKYRLDFSEEYLSTYGGVGPPIDAINELHRYRDAITHEWHAIGLGRPVVKGIALYPVPVSLETTLGHHRLHKSIEATGIGALPHLPGRTAAVEAWLAGAIHASFEVLSNAGPPFLGERFLQTAAGEGPESE